MRRIQKSGKKGGATPTVTENAKSKNPQGTKPISEIANQQLASHHSSYGKNGEARRRSLHKDMLEERWTTYHFVKITSLPSEPSLFTLIIPKTDAETTLSSHAASLSSHRLFFLLMRQILR